jgi:hypothetical protein
MNIPQAGDDQFDTADGAADHRSGLHETSKLEPLWQVVVPISFLDEFAYAPAFGRTHDPVAIPEPLEKDLLFGLAEIDHHWA